MPSSRCILNNFFAESIIFYYKYHSDKPLRKKYLMTSRISILCISFKALTCSESNNYEFINKFNIKAYYQFQIWLYKLTTIQYLLGLFLLCYYNDRCHNSTLQNKDVSYCNTLSVHFFMNKTVHIKIQGSIFIAFAFIYFLKIQILTIILSPKVSSEIQFYTLM